MAVKNPSENREPQDSPAYNSLASTIGNSHVGVRNDLDVSRHVFFGETSYIVRDLISFEGHNFAPVDYEILTSLRDDRSLNEVFEGLKLRGIVEDGQAEEFFRFVIELQKRGLLSLPVTDGESLYQQFELKRRRQAGNPIMKLLFLKIPLGSPDRFLKSTYHLVKPLFSKAFFYAWLIGILAACFIVFTRWEAFTSDLASMLAVQNLPAILIIMSVLKLWHELGHGYACRHFGVSVPNAGLLFMIGTPLAFVDATGSWSLSKRWQRQVINLGGIYFEMMIAIVAAFVWAFCSNASIQSLAHFTLLISSVTTIGFNFNPLMKYDGYFVLADALGIPNLKTRSALAAQALSKRVFLGIEQTSIDSKALRLILVVYGFCASLYKITLVIGISAILAMQVWLVGLLVGGYYLLSSFGSMLWKVVRYLAWSPEVANRKALAMSYLALIVIGIPSALWFCPVPGRSHARGVVENKNINVVHVEEGGFMTMPRYAVGQMVKKGETIGEVENINNVSLRHRKQAELNKLELRYRTEQFDDSLAASQTSQQISHLQYELNLEACENTVELIHAPIDGQVIYCSHQKAKGRYLEPGEELVRIGSEGWIIRAVADARSLADVKPAVGQSVQCRFCSDPSHVYPGTIKNVSRAGSRIVSYEVLTHLAGGFIPVDPETMAATEPFFELSIELDTIESPSFLRNGAVCEIRFERENHESFGHLAYRSFLRFVHQIHLD